ncbi:MAG: hypothetical protein WD058_00575 [Dehalococcoidia bacterium]
MTDFTYHLVKDGTVRIAHGGKTVVTLSGAKAARFRSDAADIADGYRDAEQLLMARMTGNFKRGNERDRGRRARS